MAFVRSCAGSGAPAWVAPCEWWDAAAYYALPLYLLLLVACGTACSLIVERPALTLLHKWQGNERRCIGSAAIGAAPPEPLEPPAPTGASNQSFGAYSSFASSRATQQAIGLVGSRKDPHSRGTAGVPRGRAGLLTSRAG